jgi:tryptophan synthase beta chain
MDIKLLLTKKETPKKWYSVLPDLPFVLPPPMSTITGYPISPIELRDRFPEAIIDQELDNDTREFDIPDEVQEIFKFWRPTPLNRARRFEEALGTPAQIFYKDEGVSPAGSHELNTAVAQVYYCKKQGVRMITTGTSAGEWGISLALACRFFGVECNVYMSRSDYNQKPYGRIFMELCGAKVISSPSEETTTGEKVLEKNPNSPGSLSIAISEAIEAARRNEDTKYSIGTVMNHVLLHQTIIGLEARRQVEKADTYPDIIIGCVGGGSNFAGLITPFLKDSIKGRDIRFIAVEPSSVPSLTKGRYAYDYVDEEGFAPMLKMHTLGHGFVPPDIRAGAMRYHGMSPLVSMFYKEKYIEAIAYPQLPVLESAVQFLGCEGLLPAPESAYAIKAVVDEALKCKAAREKKTILFALSTHGYFDISTYDLFLAGKLEDPAYSDEDVEKALAGLPRVQSEQ